MINIAPDRRINTCHSDNCMAGRIDSISKHELDKSPIHERLYLQNKLKPMTASNYLELSHKPSLLAITGENQTLIELKRQKELKITEKKLNEEKRKEAEEFVSKIKKEKGKLVTSSTLLNLL